MVPGEVYEITIGLFPVANLFCRGHRGGSTSPAAILRILTSIPIRESPRDPGGGPASRAIAFLSANRPSHILLPAVPSGG